RANPAVALSVPSRESEGGDPASGLVVVTGSGFGPAPNIVGFRTFLEGAEGERVLASPPAGAIGVLAPNPTYGLPFYGTMNGRPVMFMFDGVLESNRPAILKFPNTRRMRLYIKLGVPEGRYFPGGYDVQFPGKLPSPAPRTFPNDSSAKFVWVQSGF